jgi:hypothetical protein
MHRAEERNATYTAAIGMNDTCLMDDVVHELQLVTTEAGPVYLYGQGHSVSEKRGAVNGAFA